MTTPATTSNAFNAALTQTRTDEQRLIGLDAMLTELNEMDWTGPTGCFGSEFYSGDAEVIGRACREGEWDGLRDGRNAVRFVGFPPCVGNDDVPMHLFEAIARVMQTSPLQFDEFERMVAEDSGKYQGLWAAELWHSRFVDAVASVPLERIGQLTREWTEIVAKVYDARDEGWLAPTVTQAVGDFVLMCKEAVAEGHDVVEVWVH